MAIHGTRASFKAHCSAFGCSAWERLCSWRSKPAQHSHSHGLWLRGRLFSALLRRIGRVSVLTVSRLILWLIWLALRTRPGCFADERGLVVDWWFTPLGRLVESRLMELISRPLEIEVFMGESSPDFNAKSSS